MLISEGNGQKSLHQQLEKFLLNLCCNTESPTTFSDHHSLDISTAKQNYTIFGDRTFGAPPHSPMGVGTPLLLAAIGGLSNVRLKLGWWENNSSSNCIAMHCLLYKTKEIHILQNGESTPLSKARWTWVGEEQWTVGVFPSLPSWLAALSALSHMPRLRGQTNKNAMESTDRNWYDMMPLVNWFSLCLLSSWTLKMGFIHVPATFQADKMGRTQTWQSQLLSGFCSFFLLTAASQCDRCGTTSQTVVSHRLGFRGWGHNEC